MPFSDDAVSLTSKIYPLMRRTEKENAVHVVVTMGAISQDSGSLAEEGVGDRDDKSDVTATSSTTTSIH